MDDGPPTPQSFALQPGSDALGAAARTAQSSSSSLPAPPTFEPPPADPLLDMLRGQIQRDNISSIQSRVQSESARLMMMYGTRLAMSGGGASPLA